MVVEHCGDIRAITQQMNFSPDSILLFFISKQIIRSARLTVKL